MSNYPDTGDSYNGYRNYPTWAVCLWLSSDPYTQKHAYDIARDDSLSGIEKDDAFKEWIESSAPDLSASIYSDLLSYAISEVDWTQITNAFAED